MNNQLTNNVIDGNLDMSDVLAVATSRAETHFTMNLAAAKKEITKLGKDIEETEVKLQQQTDADCKVLVKEYVDQLEPTVIKLGGSVEVKGKATFDAELSKSKVTALLIIRSGGSYGTEFKFTAKVSSELLALQAQLEELRKKKEEASNQALEWKKKLSQIPQLERQYKAKIAESKLKKSTAGQEMLQLLTENLEKDMLALPSI